MTRHAPALALLLALSLVGVAAAQDGRIVDVASGPVSFTLTDDDIAAAAACPGCTYLEPDPGPAIVFEVVRQNPNRIYTIDAVHAGWNPTGPFRLEARYTVTNRAGSTMLLASPWLVLGSTPVPIFNQTDVGGEVRVRVTVAYRLVLTGDEPAGGFATRVTHRVRENGSAVSHDVRVSVPTFLTLRLVGTGASASAFTILFDYAADPGTYLRAVTTGVPLGVTWSDVGRVEVGTNHPTGYTVTLTVEEVFAPVGGASLRSRVWLQGARADGRTYTGAAPTDGFVTLFDDADFALHVTGDEPPGSYRYTVRLAAVRNP